MESSVETGSAAPNSVVCRHKRKVIILALLGLAAAIVFYFIRQPPYQSEAKMFIRYVTDSHALNPSDNTSRVTSLIDMNQNVMNSEMEILTSFDLAMNVVSNYGPDKILAKLGGGSNTLGTASSVAAASSVRNNLKVEASKDSSVIHITFQHPDPALVQPVLAEIITDYPDKHSLVHQATGMSEEKLMEQTTQLRLQIKQTEDDLRRAKISAGIISITDTEKSYQEEMSRINRELRQAEASLAEHPTSLQEMTNAAAGIKVLRVQLQQIQAEVAKLDQAEAQIADLERTKKIQEGNYQYFATVQDQARIDQQLGPGRAPNINVIQQPSPPYKDYSQFYTTVGLLAMSGLLAGLAWAGLVELFRRRSIRLSF